MLVAVIELITGEVMVLLGFNYSMVEQFFCHDGPLRMPKQNSCGVLSGNYSHKLNPLRNQRLTH